MILTVITRTFGGRPEGFARNRQSLFNQLGDFDVQHLVVRDMERRGAAWAQWNLRNVLDQILGDYVMLLDDDDYLIDPAFLSGLSERSRARPDVIVVKMDMGTYTLPPDSLWQSRPVRSFIACSCFVVRRDVWCEHVTAFEPRYDSDYDFIAEVWDHGHTFHWWDTVASAVGRVSHGEPEGGCPITDSLSTAVA